MGSPLPRTSSVSSRLRRILCLLGLLLFSMMFILLVAGFISQSTFQVITSILIVINLTGVANLVISMALALGACLLVSRSIGIRRLSKTTLPHKLSGFRIVRKTRLSFKNPLKISAAVTRQRNTCAFCLPWYSSVQLDFRQLWKKQFLELHQQCLLVSSFSRS